MSAAVLARAAARGGYGAVARKLVSSRWAPARSFSVASRLHEKKYAKSHEWVEFSADKKTATIGISDYASKAIGDVVFVELPQVDSEVGAGDTFGSVESVKSASDLYSPVAGTVIESNAALEETPSLINKDPENGAWIAKLEVTGEEVPELMAADEYKKFTDEIAEEEH